MNRREEETGARPGGRNDYYQLLRKTAGELHDVVDEMIRLAQDKNRQIAELEAEIAALKAKIEAGRGAK